MIERGNVKEPAQNHESILDGENKEIVNRGDLFFLDHPGTIGIFSGYGITLQYGRNDLLVGLLMVDRPHPVDPSWLRFVEETFGEYHLIPMTSSGDRGILCRMQIESESIPHLKRKSFEKSYTIREALQSLLDHPPKPIFRMKWNAERRVWISIIEQPNQLPEEIRSVLEMNGYGCLAVEADIGVVHVCYAPDADIPGFANKSVISQWQLIKMPTAPLIRFEMIILDNPSNPYRFESFLNVGEKDQANILAQLAGQEKLYMTFYGDDLEYDFTKIIPHDTQQWQQLDEMTLEAQKYWESIPAEKRDYDQAKTKYLSHY